jgi:outer membrane protein assembly factor BamD (BamD/ComL family)
VALLLALLLQEAWEYRQTLDRFVKGGDQKSPAEFYALGEKLYAEGDPAAAAPVFRLIADALPSTRAEHAPLREKALFSAARALYAAADFAGAYYTFESFLARHPDSEEHSRGLHGARWYLFASALALAKAGQKERVLGVAVYTSPQAGVDLLHKTMQRYPKESFTDDFIFLLGEFFYEKGRFAEADNEYKTILASPSYAATNSAPRAQLRVAELAMRRFDGVAYDVKMLADAKREYEKFISSYSQADAATLAPLDLTPATLQTMLAQAARGIAEIDEKLAEKEWTLAQWYLRRGKPNAARVYLNSIRINYGRTRWGSEAEKLLKELPSDR